MDNGSINKIKEIKGKILAMLQERHQNGHGGETILSPSSFWTDFCSFFDYMIGLPEESFAKLRLHTYHLTGDNYQTYYLGNAESFATASQIEDLTEGIPSQYILNEPKGGIGFSFENGRFLSWDVIRFQRAVSTLYKHAIFNELIKTNQLNRNIILEIGAGYGGLAHHIANILNQVTYVIVDLPETLLFSAAYLSLHNPNKRIYLYDSRDFEEFIHSKAVNSYDFILIPNYKLQELRHLNFDLALNVASFQEMRTPQAEAYLDFIKETCKGTLYSYNQDRQPFNKELSDLSLLLAQRFRVSEIPHVPTVPQKSIRDHIKNGVRLMARFVGLASNPPTEKVPLYREFLCKPLAESKQSRVSVNEVSVAS